MVLLASQRKMEMKVINLSTQIEVIRQSNRTLDLDLHKMKQENELQAR